MNTDLLENVDHVQNVDEKLIPCVIVLGMAGSGKTSFIQVFWYFWYNFFLLI